MQSVDKERTSILVTDDFTMFRRKSRADKSYRTGSFDNTFNAFFSHRISSSVLASLVDVRCSSQQNNSSNNFPRSTNIDHVDVVVLVLDPDVLAYISLNFAHVVAIRTLESRLSAALIAQMAGQVSLISEYASTVGIRAGVLVSFHEAIRALVTPQ